MPDFNFDQFEERAAIFEFDGGMSRFDAEAAAAKEQGLPRWQAVKLVKEVRDAKRVGIAGGHGDQTNALARKRDEMHLPGVQSASQEKARPMLERQPQAGRNRGALLSLRDQHGQEVQR